MVADAFTVMDVDQSLVPRSITGIPAACVRIGTYNIHSCVGSDARFSPQRTARVINELDVDLIGLQEVGWHHRGEVGVDQFNFLADATGLTAYAGPTKHNDQAHYGNAILTRLPVRAMRSIDLTVGFREPRGALDGDVLINGRVVRVIVAHLGLDPWERKRQIQQILALVEAEPGRSTLFMGDLNEWTPNSSRLRLLEDQFPGCAAPRSFPNRMPTFRLDRIFLSPDLALVEQEVMRTALTRRASDHLPVRATIGLV
ncbi:MAG: endonuclease/exonuclease/phosphatase family protein [Azospirillaceae bacterium]|nr:endonuclease/exonuclease/phosphatase family protein [Azospirillaceae bacterium]